MTEKLQRGDLVVMVYPNEPIHLKIYRISAVAPANNLSDDRVDICEEDDAINFTNSRGIGMPVKYLRKIIK